MTDGWGIVNNPDHGVLDAAQGLNLMFNILREPFSIAN